MRRRHQCCRSIMDEPALECLENDSAVADRYKKRPAAFYGEYHKLAAGERPLVLFDQEGV